MVSWTRLVAVEMVRYGRILIEHEGRRERTCWPIGCLVRGDAGESPPRKWMSEQVGNMGELPGHLMLVLDFSFQYNRTILILIKSLLCGLIPTPLHPTPEILQQRFELSVRLFLSMSD